MIKIFEKNALIENSYALRRVFASDEEAKKETNELEKKEINLWIVIVALLSLFIIAKLLRMKKS
ncbi:hypothetical protein HY450_02775 [Candidatus Pacearchaeota archaeon]|nr:hypothetical protein [Candidatus Pacearchaeota archaeon]